MLSRSIWLPPALMALLVQCVSLYGPAAGPGVIALPGSDKVAHVLMFAVPAALLVLAGVRRQLVAVGLVGQAVVSELVQGWVLADRTGDPLDALADLVGLALGLLVTARSGRPAP